LAATNKKSTLAGDLLEKPVRPSVRTSSGADLGIVKVDGTTPLRSS